MLVRLKQGVTSLSVRVKGEIPTIIRDRKPVDLPPEVYARCSRYLEVVETARLRNRGVDTLNLDVRDGIGDLHWVFLKLGAILSACRATRARLRYAAVSGRPAGRAREFAMMHPDVVAYEAGAEEICTGPDGIVEGESFHYALDPNVVLLKGGRIEDWLPDLKVDYNYPLGLPTPKPHDNIVFYFGDKLAEQFWAGPWTSKEWAMLVKGCRLKGYNCLAVGLECDEEKAKEVESEGGVFRNLIGRTSFSQCMALLLGARLVIGSISGVTILAAARGANVLALWPGPGSVAPLPERMRTSWLPSEKISLAGYTPACYFDGFRKILGQALSKLKAR